MKVSDQTFKKFTLKSTNILNANEGRLYLFVTVIYKFFFILSVILLIEQTMRILWFYKNEDVVTS